MKTETSISKSKAGFLYAFLCTFFASIMIVLVKWVQEVLPPFTVLYISLSVAGLALTAILYSRDRLAGIRNLTRKGWAWLVGISILTFFAYWTLFKAIHLLDPTVATFIGRVEVLITLLLGVLFLGERFTRRELMGGVLILAGMVIIRFAGGINISIGFFYCLAGALFWGITEGLSKVAVRHVSPLVFAWGRCVLLVPAFSWPRS